MTHVKHSNVDLELKSFRFCTSHFLKQGGFTLSLGHFPNTFCFTFPKKLLCFPNKFALFAQQICIISPTIFVSLCQKELCVISHPKKCIFGFETFIREGLQNQMFPKCWHWNIYHAMRNSTLKLLRRFLLDVKGTAKHILMCLMASIFRINKTTKSKNR